MRRPRHVGGWKADHEEAVAGQLGRFGQRLGKREVRLEAASGQVRRVMQLPRVGHPFIHENEAGTVLVHQGA